MSKLRACLVVAPAIVLATAVMGTLSMLASLFDSSGGLPHRIARVWSRILIRVSGMRVRAEGLEKINAQQGYVIASNHLSFMDTPLLLAHLPLQFRFLAKRGLFRIPFIGGHLRRAGHVAIPREDARGSLRAMSAAARLLKDRNLSALVFPEGGRSPGPLREFKDGAAYIAVKAGVPLVPVAISGTREVLPMGSLIVRPGEVLLRVGDPIPTAGLTPRSCAQLTAELRLKVLELLEA